MPVQPGPITCPKCGEDRPTLISEVIDPRGTRYVCMVCSKEFKVSVHTNQSAQIIRVE